MMDLDKEFISYKIMRVFDNAMQQAQQMNTDLGIVDLPEFCKPIEDKLTTKADNYVAMLIRENRLDEAFNKVLNS